MFYVVFEGHGGVAPSLNSNDAPAKSIQLPLGGLVVPAAFAGTSFCVAVKELRLRLYIKSHNPKTHTIYCLSLFWQYELSSLTATQFLKVG